MKPWILPAGVAVFSLTCGAAPGQEAAEIPTPPAAGALAFRARLDPAEYGKRVARLDQMRLDPAAVAASKRPDFGVVVNHSAPGGQAAEAGLLEGWIIDRYNGQEHWHHRQGLQSLGEEGRREIEAVSPQGDRRTFSFRPGKIGINSSNAHRPEQYLLRHLPRGSWDRDMLVTVQAWHAGDHALLETALARAVENGMPENPFANYHAALLALDRGERPQARRLLDSVLKAVGKEGEVPRFFRPGIRTLALGLGDFPLLRKAIAEQDGLDEELQAEMIKPWQAWAASAPQPSLIERARPMAAADLFPSVVTVNDGWEEFYRIEDAAGLRDGIHFAAKLPPDYDDYCFAPEKPVKDVLWEIRGGYGDIQPPAVFHEIAFYLVDLKCRQNAAERRQYWIPLWAVAGIRLRHDVKDGRILYLSAGINPIEIPTHRALPRLEDDQVAALVKQVRNGSAEPIVERENGFVIQLVRLGNEAEVVVNGVPYLRLPVPPSIGELGCVVHSTGMALAIDQMTLKELK